MTPLAPWPLRPAGSGSTGTRGRTAAVLAVVVLAHVLARLWLHRYRTGPLVLADEVGYLLNARVLAGGEGGDLRGTTTYAPGWSLVLAPLTALVDDPVTRYRGVLALNALASSLAVPLLYLLLRRLTGCSARLAVVAAAVAAAYPPLVLNAGLAWPESVLAPLVALWLLALVHAAHEGAASWRAHLAAGVLTAGLIAVHGRMAPLAVVHLLLVLLPAVRDLPRLLRALTGVAALVAVVVATRRLDSWLVLQSYDPRPYSVAQTLLENLGTPGGLGRTAALVVGQLWYAGVSSAGLAVLGLLGAGAQAWGRLRAGEGEATSGPLGTAALACLLAVAGTATLTAASFQVLSRSDYYVYGRYLEPFVPLLAAGGCVLVRTAPRRSLAAAAAGAAVALPAAAGLVRWFAGDRLLEPANAFVILGLHWPANGSGGTLGLPRATVAAVLAGAAVVLALRAALPAGAAVALALAVLSVDHTADRVLRPLDALRYPDTAAVRRLTEITGDRRVATDLARGDTVVTIGLQYLVPGQVLLFDSGGEPVPAAADLVLTVGGAPPPEPAATPVWTDPGGRAVLWSRPAG